MSQGLRPRAAAGLLALLLAGCTSVSQRVADDRAQVGELFDQRVGQPLPDESLDDADVAAAVAELLAGGLDEERALKLAVLNNRDVRARLAELGVASSDVVQAGLVRNPVFVLDAKFFSGGTEIEVGLMQSFMDLFFLSARKRIAEGELEAVRAHIAGELTGLAFDVRRACVHVRADERALELERARARTAQAAADLMGDLFAAGNITAVQPAGEALDSARAQLALARAEIALVESRESLSTLLGLWGESLDWKLVGSFKEPPAPSWPADLEGAALEASFALAENRALAGSEARRAGITDWEQAFGDTAFGLVAKREVGSSEWGLGPAVAVNVPLFDTGSAARSAALLRARGLVERHVQLAVEVRSAARRLDARRRSLDQQLELIDALELPAAAGLVHATLQDYNAMQIGVFEVLRARQQELVSQRDRLSTQEWVWIARLDLQELLCGVLNHERLNDSMPAGESAGRSASTGGH